MSGAGEDDFLSQDIRRFTNQWGLPTMEKKELMYICPKAETCVEDCECKEPHLKKDCMRGDPADPDLLEDCFVVCVPVSTEQRVCEKCVYKKEKNITRHCELCKINDYRFFRGKEPDFYGEKRSSTQSVEPEKKEEKCPKCKGIGKIFLMNPDTMEEDINHAKICPICKGTGKPQGKKEKKEWICPVCKTAIKNGNKETIDYLQKKEQKLRQSITREVVEKIKVIGKRKDVSGRELKVFIIDKQQLEEIENG